MGNKWLPMNRVRRRQWHPTPVLLPGESHGRSSLEGCSPWGRWGSDATERLTFTFHFHALEKEMATHSSVLAWRIPGTGEPGGLPSMGSHRVGHDWSDFAAWIEWKKSLNDSVSHRLFPNQDTENDAKNQRSELCHSPPVDTWKQMAGFQQSIQRNQVPLPHTKNRTNVDYLSRY